MRKRLGEAVAVNTGGIVLRVEVLSESSQNEGDETKPDAVWFYLEAPDGDYMEATFSLREVGNLIALLDASRGSQAPTPTPNGAEEPAG